MPWKLLHSWWRLRANFSLYLGAPKISLQTHSNCPPPRKSLVKGERFIRVEGKPKLGALA